MARKFLQRDISPIHTAANTWIQTCLIKDASLFSSDSRWTPQVVQEVFHAFVEHPDSGQDDFMTKLKGQMKSASASAQQLMAEMLWSLLLFPSNMRARTKRQQIRDIWALSGQPLAESHPLLSDNVLVGVGSGGPGFNNYRPEELEYLIALVRNLKQKDQSERQHILTDYKTFLAWIESVPRKGSRQFRHMLRFFAFPDRVERISSNNDRRKILKAFLPESARDVSEWNDRQLDEKLLELRKRLEGEQPSAVLDFYEEPLRAKWAADRKVKTVSGVVTVTVPGDEEDFEEKGTSGVEEKAPEARYSIQIQAKLARIGAVMGFKVWIPRADRARVKELLHQEDREALIDDLPLNYDNATIDTIELIDVIWLRRRSIVRAFESNTRLRCTRVFCGWPICLHYSPTWIFVSTLSRPTSGGRRCFVK